MLAENDLVILARIVEPFAGERPTGPDLRDDLTPGSPYSRLRDMRASAREEERQLDHEIVSENRVPSAWATVEALALETLAERSKDLEIGCWLAESLTRRRGLPGLALGAAIMTALVDRYWRDGLHPAADPDDPDARSFAVTGLSGSDRDGSLMQPLRKVVLFECADGTEVTTWHYERARSVAALPETQRKAQLQKAHVLEFGALEVAARGAGRPTLRTVAHAVADARAAWTALETALERVTPDATPSTGRVGALLEAIEAVARRYLPETDWAPETVANEASATDGPAPAAPAADGAGVDRSDDPPVALARPRPPTREELLDEILRIAVLFRAGEPNSPLSYTLEEAVRRARLPLPDLLRELIPELPARATVLTTLGIRPPPE